VATLTVHCPRWFTVMDRTLKGVTGFDAVSVIKSFCSPPMLTWRSSANLMNNGASLVVRPGNTVWFAYNTKTGGVVAYTFSPRTDETCRELLTLRTRIKRLTRKTICFPHSIELHEKVIGAFIEKYMF